MHINFEMFCTSPSLFVIFSFLAAVPVVSFARSFAAESFEFFTTSDSAFTNDVLPDDISNENLFIPSPDENTNQSIDPDSTFSTELAANFLDPDAGATLSSNYLSVSDEENLLANNKASGEICKAEGDSPSPLIGRLRVRGSAAGGGGTVCGAMTQGGSSDEGLDSFLDSLPQVFAPTDPGIRERKDICPPEQYETRNIPLCSSGNPAHESFIPGLIPGTTEIMLFPAYPCKFFFTFVRSF